MKRKPIQFNITKTGCHELISHQGKYYPHLYINKKIVNAHRYIFEMCYGAIAEGAIIRHICNNPKCINPQHLRSGTHKDNTADMITAGTQPWEGENHYKAKLNESQILEIRASKLRVKVLVKRYGVSHQTIYRIKNNKIWKRVVAPNLGA